MSRAKFRRFASSGIVGMALVVAVLLGAARPAQAQDTKTAYPNMAPVEKYMMDRNAEIALAQSAAPEAIAREAEVMVLTVHGYESAVKGKNGFVCIVERGWAAGPDDPDFWNPKLRGPLCLNPPAARTYLPFTIKKTELVLAGHSKAQMVDGIKSALDKKELPAMEAGAMCYMLSKDGYLGDGNGHWRPHLMFFVPQTEAITWGAGVPGSPIIAANDDLDRLTVFLIPVGKWSDGTGDSAAGH